MHTGFAALTPVERQEERQPWRKGMLFYCRFTWYPGTSREAVGRRLLAQDSQGSSHRERIKGWYTLAGGGAGFLMIEADTPEDVSEIVEPYMDLMAWDVHAVSVTDYQETVDAMRSALEPTD